jgi:hypothetical protein
MSIEVACIACGGSFDALRHPGLVRCAPCEDASIPLWPNAQATTVTFDTPGEAWA